MIFWRDILGLRYWRLFLSRWWTSGGSTRLLLHWEWPRLDLAMLRQCFEMPRRCTRNVCHRQGSQQCCMQLLSPRFAIQWCRVCFLPWSWLCHPRVASIDCASDIRSCAYHPGNAKSSNWKSIWCAPDCRIMFESAGYYCPIVQCHGAGSRHCVGGAFREFPPGLPSSVARRIVGLCEYLRLCGSDWPRGNLRTTGLRRTTLRCHGTLRCTCHHHQKTKKVADKRSFEDTWILDPPLLYLFVLRFLGTVPLHIASEWLENYAGRWWHSLQSFRHPFDLVLDEWNILHPSNQLPHSVLLDCAAAATPRQSSRGCFRTCLFLLDPAFQTRIWDVYHCFLGAKLALRRDTCDAIHGQSFCDGKLSCGTFG